MAAIQNHRQQQKMNALSLKRGEQALAHNDYKMAQEKQRNALAGQFGGDIANRKQVAKEMYSVDPQMAMQMEKSIQGMEADKRKQLEDITQQAGKLAATVLATPDEQFDQVYQTSLMQAAKQYPGAVDDAPPMNASIEEKRAWLQQQVNEASTIQQILDRNNPKEHKYTKPFEAIDENGNPVFVQQGPNGQLQSVDGFRPPEKQQGLFVRTGPDGTVISTNGQPENVPLTKSVTTGIQKEIAGLEETFSRVMDIDQRYNPSFMTFQGKLGAYLSELKDKAAMDMSDDERKFLKDFTKFRTMVNRDFNAYRKEITGAAASVQELESLKKATIAEDQSPAQFEANMEVYKEELLRAMRIKRRLLREGISVGSREFGDAMDRLYLNGHDDDGETRLAELQEQGFDETAAIDRLIEEGYSE